MDITVRDAENGVASIVGTKLVNVTVAIPSFSPGTLQPIVVTATKIDPALPSQVELRACTPDGCCQDGDPVLAVLRIPKGKRSVRETFAGLPANERFVRVQNGSPGMQRVEILVNGLRVKTFRLGWGEVGMTDIGSSLMRTKNIITVIGFGQPGHSSLVLISDDPGPKGAPGNSVALPRVAWEQQGTPEDQNLRWGG